MRNQTLSLALAAVISAFCGAAAGYAIGRGTHELPEEVTLPIYLAATSPSALQPPQQEMPPIPRYVLSTDHGFVAVFNVSTQGLTLKERTRTPESALSPDERKRLSDGIHLYTEEQMLRALQDYGS